MNRSIDDLDKGIIKYLSKDGRMSFTEIASNLDVTEKTVRTRYKNLLEQELLVVVGVLNPVAIGIKAGAIIQLKVQLPLVDQVIEDLKKLKEIRFITSTSGKYQLIIQVNVPTQDDLSACFKKIQSINGIVEMNSTIQLEVYKNTFEYF
ncbi:MAG TPA: Lrp/AsnC family transcriptional regulator [Pseudoneobacillus sp.]|nr:Lrp/AsnC family transcriptional regulator [Pseudoneobacillus sp.]